MSYIKARLQRQIRNKLRTRSAHSEARSASKNLLTDGVGKLMDLTIRGWEDRKLEKMDNKLETLDKDASQLEGEYGRLYNVIKAYLREWNTLVAELTNIHEDMGDITMTFPDSAAASAPKLWRENPGLQSYWETIIKPLVNQVAPFLGGARVAELEDLLIGVSDAYVELAKDVEKASGETSKEFAKERKKINKGKKSTAFETVMKTKIKEQLHERLRQ